MACLNLTNGAFTNVTWGTTNFNQGDVTITRTASEITIERTGIPGLTLSGNFQFAVFGANQNIALLRNGSSGSGPIPWTVSIVDITGPTLSAPQLFSVTLPSSHSPPSLLESPGNGSLAALSSGTGTANELTNILIVRSDDGTVVLSRPGTVAGLTAVPSVEVTATQVIFHHPNQFSADSTAAPRPTGSLLQVNGAEDFGQAVLGAANAALATVTRTIDLTNTGADCLTINAIANDGLYTVVATSSPLPLELGHGEDMTVTVTFAPTAVGNNLQGILAVDADSNTGETSVICLGDARMATAQISVAPEDLLFGTVPVGTPVTDTFTITNTGESDLTVTIPTTPPAGSPFTWVPTGGNPALPVAGPPITVTVTYTPQGGGVNSNVPMLLAPSAGQNRTVTLDGTGCVPLASMVLPTAAPLVFGRIERGFRTVRFINVTNAGNAPLNFGARIVPAPGVDPAEADLFGLVLIDNDITDAPSSRNYNILPTSQCGAGPTGPGTGTVGVSFYADAAPRQNPPYTARLEITDPITGQVTLFPLEAFVDPAVPVDAVLVLDRSGSMNDSIGERSKMEAALAAGRLFVQMLRNDADDRAAIIAFNENPDDVQSIVPVAGNRATLETALSGITPGGATNIAGGIILGEEEFDDPSHPSNPPDLKKTMIVLTDGKENRAFQRGGAGPWFSITGRDSDDSPVMRRPDGTPQDTDPLPVPVGVQVYGIGLGNPADIDGTALDALSSATGASYNSVVELTGTDFFLLEKHFTEIFMNAAGMAPVSDPFYTIVAGDRHEHEFDIFPGDVNCMVVVYDQHGRRLPFALRTPKGEEISGSVLPPGFGLRHHSSSSARFVEVTFPKGEPERYAGRWTVVVAHNGEVCYGDINLPERKKRSSSKSKKAATAIAVGAYKKRTEYHKIAAPGFIPLKCEKFDAPLLYGIAIGAGSNLRMQPFVEPGTKYVGDSLRLNAVLSEAALPVRNATVRVTIEAPVGPSYTVTLRDDGAHEDGEADDGDYGGLFFRTDTAGVYRLTFRAEGLQAGRPYVRESHRTKVVYDPRTPPTGGKPGSQDDCCEKLLKAIVALTESKKP